MFKISAGNSGKNRKVKRGCKLKGMQSFLQLVYARLDRSPQTVQKKYS